MRLLVWQWGRRGAGPKFAVELAAALRQLPGIECALSLSSGAEILAGPQPPRCDLPVATYNGVAGLALRLLAGPAMTAGLVRRLRPFQLDAAICAMPGPLDRLLVAALRRLGARIDIIVHDADAHPGDGVPVLMWLQRRLSRMSDGLVTLSQVTATRLRQQGLPGNGRPILVLSHPPFRFGPMPAPPFQHGGPARLLFFGRLLAYKGLDLLAEAFSRLDSANAELRVVGQGPEDETLAKLRTLPGVTVENRWVPEQEIGESLGWADALVLPYREASQSGPAAAAIAAGRWVIATNVNGLREQLEHEPLAVLCDPDAARLAAAITALCRSRPTPSNPRIDPQAAWRIFAAALVAHVETQLARRP